MQQPIFMRVCKKERREEKGSKSEKKRKFTMRERKKNIKRQQEYEKGRQIQRENN